MILIIARNYHMLKESGGHSFRGYFIINPEGVIRGRTVSDLPVAIHTNHLVRQVFNKNILDFKVKEN